MIYWLQIDLFQGGVLLIRLRVLVAQGWIELVSFDKVWVYLLLLRDMAVSKLILWLKEVGEACMIGIKCRVICQFSAPRVKILKPNSTILILFLTQFEFFYFLLFSCHFRCTPVSLSESCGCFRHGHYRRRSYDLRIYRNYGNPLSLLALPTNLRWSLSYLWLQRWSFFLDSIILGLSLKDLMPGSIIRRKQVLLSNLKLLFIRIHMGYMQIISK